MFLLQGVLCLLLAETVTPIASDTVSRIEVRTSLFKKLLSKYDKRILPQHNETTPVDFGLGIRLLNIVELFEHEEVLETGVYIYQKWKDIRLSWDPSDYDGFKHINVPIDELWHPELAIWNSVEVGLNQMNVLAEVRNDGLVVYSPRARTRTRCEMDLTEFPFDTQTCSMKFASYSYNGFQVNLSSMLDSPTISDGITNKEWSVTAKPARLVTTSFECCPEPYQHMIYEFKFKRNPIYFIYVFLLPAVILAVLVPFQFLLPPNCKERLSIGSCLLLGCILLISMVQGYLPDAHPTLPYLVQYYCLTLLWIALSMMCSSWVINIYSWGPRHTRVPRFIGVFLKIFKKIVCLSDDTYYPMDDAECISLRGADTSTLNSGSNKNDGNTLEKDVGEILRHLNTLVVRNVASESRREGATEWYQLALVIDRILGFIFVVIFLIYTCVLVK